MELIHEKKDKQQKSQVVGTNSFSTVSKYSMVTKGYCCDDFLKYFVQNKSPRTPIINRGYYVRFKAVEYGWKLALLPNKKNIIISLGSGFDTSAFRYSDHFFIEIDYPTVCRKKAEIIKTNDLIKDIQADNIELGLHLISSNYVLFGGDLRKPLEVAKFFATKIINELIEKSFQNSEKDGINLILFNECSLCYLEQELSDQLIEIIIKIFGQQFSESISLITYFGYEMLKSKCCQNNFGSFLFNHFEKLGAPILTFLNEDQIQERFTKLNFDQINILNMKKFYHEILNKDLKELERIKSIEPFDEWEELDNVCASYSLVICKRVNETICPIQFKNVINEENLYKSPDYSNYPIISVFGHCSNFDSDRKTIQIFGGFGLEPNKSFTIDDFKNIQSSGHRKLQNILELSLNNHCDEIIKVNVIKSKNSESAINRMHCRIVPLEKNLFILSGGRTSPAKSMSNSFLKIDFELNEFKLFDDLNCSAYRHVCSLLGLNSGQLIQFAGINSNKSVDQSIFIFDIKSTKWFTRKIRNLKTDRHSLAFCSFGSHSILFNGGLDFNNNYIQTNYLEMIDHRDPYPKQYLITSFDQKLYSHQMKISSEYMILIIGGIGNQIISNDLYQIDFRSMKVLKKYHLTCNDNKILMLQNFSSQHIGLNNLWLIGGGGNCFSFGTHFNSVQLYKLDE